MPGFSRFYSANEEEAAVRVLQFFTQQSEGASCFSSSNAKQLAQLLNGTTVSSSRPRNDFNQPLFRPKPHVQSVDQLFNTSKFSISQKSVYRNKPVRYESNSEDLQEWQIQSRTPSSDEPSPQKYRLPSPTLSTRAETSSISSRSDDGLAHLIKPARQKHLRDGTSHADYNATYSQMVLQMMDTQFSKWSYDLNEGETAVPFVMARAPAETHERLVEVDRKFWDTGVERSAADAMEERATAKLLLEHVGQKISGGVRAVKVTRRGVSSEADCPPRDDSTSKRAALIAKSKFSKDSSLVASRSVGQRRSALHKNKNRRSIMSSPPPTARKPEPTQDPNSQVKNTKPTILVLDSKDDQQRRNVDSAIQNRSIDFEDRHTLESLMEQLSRAKARDNKEHLLEEAPVSDLRKDGGEQTGRLKGKARRKKKSHAAR